MKKAILSVACAVVLAMGLTSCASVSTIGSVYTSTTAPVAISSNQMGTKVGEARILNILGVVALGDGGIQAAAKKAGITHISHVDVKTFSILGVYTTVDYIVYGN